MDGVQGELSINNNCRQFCRIGIRCYFISLPLEMDECRQHEANLLVCMKVQVDLQLSYDVDRAIHLPESPLERPVSTRDPLIIHAPLARCVARTSPTVLSCDIFPHTRLRLVVAEPLYA